MNWGDCRKSELDYILYLQNGRIATSWVTAEELGWSFRSGERLRPVVLVWLVCPVDTVIRWGYVALCVSLCPNRAGGDGSVSVREVRIDANEFMLVRRRLLVFAESELLVRPVV